MTNPSFNQLKREERRANRAFLSFFLSNRIVILLTVLSLILFFIVPLVKLVFLSFQSDTGITLNHYTEMLKIDMENVKGYVINRHLLIRFIHHSGSRCRMVYGLYGYKIQKNAAYDDFAIFCFAFLCINVVLVVLYG